MVHIPAEIRILLKKPLGRLVKDFGLIRKLGSKNRIISVGDVCTLGLLAMGIRPHLAVFDHLFMRQKLDRKMINLLDLNFKRQKRYSNPPGTLSDRIISDAKGLISEGGAVLIDGEEDLTALAFIMAAGKGDIIVYGQPGEGMVIVLPQVKLKKKIKGWLAASLGHEIERDIRKDR